jgi:hypothetical protein
MDYNTYKIIHVLGLVFVMLGLGAILGAGREVERARKVGGMLHGIGMLALLVAGVGMVHKSGIGWPGWTHAKIGIWLVIGMLPVAVRKGWVPSAIGWLLAAGLAVVAAWLALAKPF